MINLVFIIPYEEMRPLVERALGEYSCGEQICASIYLFKTVEVGDCLFQGDVIISRGFTAQMLQRQYPHLVCVPIKVSGYDIIRAITRAEGLYAPRKIALIGSSLMVYEVEDLAPIFSAEIMTYQEDDITRVPLAVERARADGCDCFIGGLTLVESCGPGDKALMIETGRAAVIETLDEAIRLTRQTRIERNRAASLRTIINHSRQGIVFIDESGGLAAINAPAAAYFHLEPACTGRKAREVLPFLGQLLEEVEKTGADINSEIIVVDEQLFAIDIIPTVRERGLCAGGIILFVQSVSSIQKDESLIRKKIQGKGLKAKYTFDDITCASVSFGKVLDRARQFSRVDSPILITGESGTGKELLAQSIHNASPRRGGPFVAINCAALPENLLESELFGYSEGAFTGALKGGKPGLFEMAHGGSIFLDEISEIPVSFQSKLLRVLQENEVRRIGDDKVLSLDIRVITATNNDVREQVRCGRFRQDLLFRLNVLTLNIPPLRERPEDIIDLFRRCIAEFSKKYHKEIALISGEARRLLTGHIWEGNVRELRNVAEKICVLNFESAISGDIVRELLYDSGSGRECPLEDLAGSSEQEMLRTLIEKYSGHKGRIAGHLGIDRTTLWRKLKKYQIQN